jgi:hypothetical protein
MAHPSSFVGSVAASGPLIATSTSWSATPDRSTTWTPSVPCVGPNEPTGGASRLSKWTLRPRSSPEVAVEPSSM